VFITEMMMMMMMVMCQQSAAAAHIWNTLPTDVVAASSLSTFRRLLKRFLFKQSYHDIIYWHNPAHYRKLFSVVTLLQFLSLG